MGYVIYIHYVKWELSKMNRAVIMITVVVFLLLLFLGTAGAYNPDDLLQLETTDQCPGCNLSGANLSDAYLSGANLSMADLSEANLRNAYLSGADLSGANLD